MGCRLAAPRHAGASPRPQHARRVAGDGAHVAAAGEYGDEGLQHLRLADALEAKGVEAERDKGVGERADGLAARQQVGLV